MSFFFRRDIFVAMFWLSLAMPPSPKVLVGDAEIFISLRLAAAFKSMCFVPVFSRIYSHGKPEPHAAGALDDVLLLI
ncbi:hypothetical protein WME94_47750 [Sorangium sp. So ce429]